MNTRSDQLEIIDLGPDFYSKEEYFDCLHQLDRIGRWLGGDRATLGAFSNMQPHSILDVGCGGGTFAIRLAKRFPSARVTGIDLNPFAIEFANSYLAAMKKAPENIQFEIKELDEPPKSYDVVTCTLVCHHLKSHELIRFLADAGRIARKKVIINDLHRHPLALFLFKLISPICFPNRLVRHDGPLSVRRALTRQEWVDYLKRAGIKRYTIRRRFAFRWIIEIDCEEM